MAEITWTIGDLARMSGVTSRTLRHYDAIGLLAPSGAGAGGRRLYGRAELLRLQQVLVLRELGVPLATIAEILHDGADRGEPRMLERLREHHEALLAERDRFDRLASTVEITITALTRGEDMAADKLYEGFGDHRAYDAEARERWGDEPVEVGNAAWERMGPASQDEHERETVAISTGLAAAMADGAGPGDDRVQALATRHYAWVAAFWTPSAATYAGLGQMYLDDTRFTAYYDAYAPGLAAYLARAMTIYAETNLT